MLSDGLHMCHAGDNPSTLQAAYQLAPRHLATSFGTTAIGVANRPRSFGKGPPSEAEHSPAPYLMWKICPELLPRKPPAASHRYRRKRTAYARVEPNGYSFVPFSRSRMGAWAYRR
jgi:hypothetical protein